MNAYDCINTLLAPSRIKLHKKSEMNAIPNAHRGNFAEEHILKQRITLHTYECTQAECIGSTGGAARSERGNYNR